MLSQAGKPSRDTRAARNPNAKLRAASSLPEVHSISRALVRALAYLKHFSRDWRQVLFVDAHVILVRGQTKDHHASAFEIRNFERGSGSGLEV